MVAFFRRCGLAVLDKNPSRKTRRIAVGRVEWHGEPNNGQPQAVGVVFDDPGICMRIWDGFSIRWGTNTTRDPVERFLKLDITVSKRSGRVEVELDRYHKNAGLEEL